MKVRNVLLLVLATVLLFNCSCQKPQSGQESSSDGEVVEQPEPQRMAYRLGETAYADGVVYIVFGTSYTKSQVYAIDCNIEDFVAYTPCFDPVCSHWDRSVCNIATSKLSGGTDLFTAFLYNGEPTLVLYNPIDTCISMPYSNTKVNLLCEDFVTLEKNDYSEANKKYKEWFKSEAKPERSEQLVYGDYFYYVELKNGVRTQYRMSLLGGEPERVFKEDNIIIRTIINDRFYGIRYDIEPDSTDDIVAREDMYYFRSDMNYENVEALPEILDFFALQGDVGFTPKSNAILDADKEFIYVTKGMKVWAVSDSDIYAEPILLSDMKEKIPEKILTAIDPTTIYIDGVIYCISNNGQYNRDLLNDKGEPAKPTQWYESSTLYSFDIRTGESNSWDVSDQSCLVTSIFYVDGKYLYGFGKYIHDDGRGIQGVTMRLTLDTKKYEVILPDRFWEYSAETTS